MNSQEAPVGPLFMAWMFMAWIVLSPAPHDINNEGDDDNQEQEIEGKCNSLKIHKMALEPIGHSVVIFLGEMQTKFYCQNISIIIIIIKRCSGF